MAKKKDAEEAMGDLSTLTEKYVSKQFGSVMVGADSILADPKRVLPLSPQLDIGLNGGIPEGTFVIFNGPPKCGKTTMALDFASTCQANNMTVYWGDVEHRLKKMNLTGIKGLKTDDAHLKVIKSTKDKILSAENFLDIFHNILTTQQNVLLVVDSFGSLCSSAEFSSGMEDQQRADVNKLLYKFCRKIAPALPINNNIIIAMTHMMSNPTGYGPARVEKGGFGMKYQSDIKLVCEKTEYIANKAGLSIGYKSTWKIEYSALGPPGAKVESYVRFGVGIDKVCELIECCKDMAIIEDKGAWLGTPSLKVTNHNGMEKLWKYLSENPDELEVLQSVLRTTCGMKVESE